jgi:hypothetical protein
MKNLKGIFAVFWALITIDTYAQPEKYSPLSNRILYSKYTIADFFKDGGKWVWELDVVYRRQSELNQSNFYMHPLRLSFRPWIAYQFTKLTRVSFNPIGVFYSAPRYPLETDLARSMERELRTTLQINNYAYYGRVNFTHRLRFESRWRGVEQEGAPNHSFRIRYRIRTRIPLNTDYFYKNNTIYLSQYSEIHTEFGRDYGRNVFSQNRNYIGVGYRFWDWARIELGYIHQYNPRPNLMEVDVSNGPMFYLFIDWLSKLRVNK